MLLNFWYKYIIPNTCWEKCLTLRPLYCTFSSGKVEMEGIPYLEGNVVVDEDTILLHWISRFWAVRHCVKTDGRG